jgi:predicted phosphodiesterase
MPEMRVTRRGFLGEALAAFGFAAAGGRTLFAAPKGWKPPKGAKLVFGALSDTHLRTDYTGLKAARTFPHKYFISALEYFRSQNVDAVVHCGDAAHRGQIRELEFHAEAWNKVFPKGLAPDGHRIEKLFVTGNHEIDGWQYGNDTGFKVERVFKDPEERARRILATDIASSWERVWGETYEPVWHKEVKGYHFFGRHYGAEERKIARLVKVIEKKQGFRDGRKPFFVLSHIRPHAALNRAMAKFPEAVSLFGHWHNSASNWNVIFDWNGAIAIQVPACLPKGWLPLAHDAYITKAKLEGGEREKIGVARHGYVFRLYDDMMAIERREFGEGGSLGTDWIMPLDACKIENGKVKPHPFSREELKKVIGEPQFREGAKLVVEDGKVKIPLADGNPKCRVYAYEVAVDGELRKAVYAAGGNMGIGHETNGGVTEVEIPNQDLPAGAAAAIAVTPLSSLGTRGRPITINSFRG